VASFFLKEPVTLANPYPNPNDMHPLKGVTRTVYLKNIITSPQIIVGDYTYYDDPEDVLNFEKNVLYIFDFIGDRLMIGKFCQIATGARFIMNGGNHSLDGFSTYPFQAFQWPIQTQTSTGFIKGDTIVGNDVWIGNSATFLPGVCVGDGAIIGANSVVTKNVVPYSIVAGSPAREIRKRFDVETIHFLLELKWWDWEVEKIVQYLDDIVQANLCNLQKLAS